jgi:hypothetical protein
VTWQQARCAGHERSCFAAATTLREISGLFVHNEHCNMHALPNLQLVPT